MKKLTALLLVLLVSLMMFTSCGAMNSNGAPAESRPTVGAPDSSENAKPEGDVSYVEPEDYARKIIKTYNLSLETKNYAAARDDIVITASDLGGYVSDSTETDAVDRYGKKIRKATFTVRVPSEKVDSYVDDIAKNASVISKKLSTQDITSTYYDLESQLESLVEQEARIRKLMDEATNYNYLLELDNMLTSIRAQINNINKQIQLYDKSVALSYVYITLSEVAEYTEIEEKEPTFGERIAEAFVGTFENFWIFCQDFFISIIWMLPAIIIAAVAIPLVLFFRKKKREKKEAERRAKEEKK